MAHGNLGRLSGVTRRYAYALGGFEPSRRIVTPETFNQTIGDSNLAATELPILQVIFYANLMITVGRPFANLAPCSTDVPAAELPNS